MCGWARAATVSISPRNRSAPTAMAPEHLDGNRAAVLQVPGEENERHPSLAQLPFDRVALGEGSLEADEEVCHVGVALETQRAP